jgi:hypothetical protein
MQAAGSPEEADNFAAHYHCMMAEQAKIAMGRALSFRRALLYFSSDSPYNI